MNKFLYGAILGFGIGMLLAPAKGDETRKMIGDSLNGVMDFVNNFVDNSTGSIEDIRSNLERELLGLDNDVQQKILGLFDQVNAKK